MNLIYSEFKRKFSMSMYKNLKIMLGEMSFSKDFVNDTCGDLYPIIQKSEDCIEIVENNFYALRKGNVKRLFCQFFPYATYEVTTSLINGEVGFCFRLSNPKTQNYSYVFFASKEPFGGYRYIGKGVDGSETGGSFMKINGELLFVCGNSYNAKSEYRIYSKEGMKTAAFNYPDGGFRGWGTVLPIKMGSRIRYFWLTFDRHKGSDYTWSYGNLYCFEANVVK